MTHPSRSLSRRSFLSSSATSIALAASGASAQETSLAWQPQFMIASCMYGMADLSGILPELDRLGCRRIDLWPRVHGSQREQVDEMGITQFQSMCDEYDVRVACLSQYKLGAFGLADEIVVASQLDCPRIVVHAGGRPGKTWPETRDAIKRFVAQIQPTLELAGEHDVRIVVENHGSTMLDSFDAIDCFLDHIKHPQLRLALAPAHLSSRSESPELAESIARLIHRAGPRLDLFYAWQHGDGFRTALPMPQQRQQMPGTGPLDFAPAMKALAATHFTGVIEVMMHPTPRGIPIAPSITGVTDAIDQSHQYLRKCLSS